MPFTTSLSTNTSRLLTPVRRPRASSSLLNRVVCHVNTNRASAFNNNNNNNDIKGNNAPKQVGEPVIYRFDGSASRTVARRRNAVGDKASSSSSTTSMPRDDDDDDDDDNAHKQRAHAVGLASLAFAASELGLLHAADATTDVVSSIGNCATMPYALGCFQHEAMLGMPVEITLAMAISAVAYLAIVSYVVAADSSREKKSEETSRRHYYDTQLAAAQAKTVRLRRHKNNVVTYQFAASSSSSSSSSAKAPRTNARIATARNADARELRRAHLESLPPIVKAVLPEKAAAEVAMRQAGVKREKSRFQNNIVFKFPKSADRKDDDDDEDDNGHGGGGGGSGTKRFGRNKETTTTSTSSSSSSDGRGGFFRWRGAGEMSLAVLLCLSLVDDAAVIAAPYLLSHLPGR